MTRSIHNGRRRKGSPEVRSLLLTVVAFACGLLVWNMAARLWRDKMVEAVVQVSKDSEKTAPWKSAPVPTNFTINDYSSAALLNGGLYHPERR